MGLFKGIKNYFVPSADNAYRPYLLRRHWLAFFLTIIIATEGLLVAGLIARQTGQNFLAAVVPAEVIALTNTQREGTGAGDVTEDALLTDAAQAKAKDMALKGYFSHVGPDGKTPWQWIAEEGYQYQYAGENLAVRFIDSKDVVNAWMQSPTHRENIVKPVYTKIGVGVAQGLFQGELATYVVQYFASPAEAAPAITATAVSVPASAPARPLVLAPQTPRVEGVSVSPQDKSAVQSVTRQLTRALANPQESSAWVLGSVAALLVVVLGLTFFMHVQLQPGTMLMSGALVAMLAISFLTINTRLVEGGADPGNAQSAGVIEASMPGGVVVSHEAASTGYAFFPQAP
jgi:hypothetical protein